MDMAIVGNIGISTRDPGRRAEEPQVGTNIKDQVDMIEMTERQSV